MKNAAARRGDTACSFSACRSYDSRRGSLSEFMCGTRVRLNSSHRQLTLSLSLSLCSRTLRGYVDEPVHALALTHTKQPLDRARAEAPRARCMWEYRFCIFQADNLSISSLPPSLPPSTSPRRVRRDKATEKERERRGRIQLGTIVPPGRRIMRLFKGRKFSSVAERGKSISRTLSTLVLAPDEFILPLASLRGWGVGRLGINRDNKHREDAR